MGKVGKCALNLPKCLRNQKGMKLDLKSTSFFFFFSLGCLFPPVRLGALGKQCCKVRLSSSRAPLVGARPRPGLRWFWGPAAETASIEDCGVIPAFSVWLCINTRTPHILFALVFPSVWEQWRSAIFSWFQRWGLLNLLSEQKLTWALTGWTARLQWPFPWM